MQPKLIVVTVIFLNVLIQPLAGEAPPAETSVCGREIADVCSRSGDVFLTRSLIYFLEVSD
jgi:hypothetical protein